MNEYNPELLQALHKVEISILKEIERVCEKNNISYFAYAGTLIGAVRHKGFIPWDDDIDLAMLRDDYEKFLKVAPKELQDGFSIDHASFNEYLPIYYIKVCKDGTLFSEDYMKDVQMHHGVFIDIFPFDKIIQGRCKQIGYKIHIEFLNQLNRAKILKRGAATSSKIKQYIAFLLRTILQIVLLPIPRSLLFKKMDEYVRKYNATETNWYSTRGYGIVQKRDLLPLRKMKFENTEIVVPNNPDAMLKDIYGDYMKLPPKAKQIGHAPSNIQL